MITFFAILAGLLILTLLVVIHELGHGIVARRNGVKVEEFGIGFPPRAKGWKIPKSFLGENVEYTLNWLPLGGFVKLQGEHDEDGGKEGDFGRASFWAKTKIMLAGVAVNWVAAIVLLAGLSLVGIPKLIDNQFTVPSDTVTTTEIPVVNFVEGGSPAAKAGLETGDKIVRIDGQELDSAASLSTITEENKGETIEIVYERDGETATTTATLRDDNDDNKGYLGAAAFQREWYRATWSAPIVGVGLTAQLSWLTLQGIGDMAANFVTGVVGKLSPNQETQDQADEKIAAAGQNVAGPVGLIGVILPGLIQAGPQYIVLITAVISLSLAVLNSLPIPGLDGGRWTLIAVYRVLRRPLTKEREEQVVGYGMMFLLGLFALITVADIGKFFG